MPGEITIGSPAVGPSVNSPGWLGRAGWLQPARVPRERGPNRPPLRGAPPDQLVEGGRRGTRPRWAGVECHLRSDYPDRNRPCENKGRTGAHRPLSRGPFLYTLRAPIGSNLVEKCSCQNLSSQRAFFCMAKEHKRPVAGPRWERSKSKILRGRGLGRRRRKGRGHERGGQGGRPVQHLVVALPPVPAPPLGRPTPSQVPGGPYCSTRR